MSIKKLLAIIILITVSEISTADQTDPQIEIFNTLSDEFIEEVLSKIQNTQDTPPARNA